MKRLTIYWKLTDPDPSEKQKKTVIEHVKNVGLVAGQPWIMVILTDETVKYYRSEDIDTMTLEDEKWQLPN